MPGRLEWIGLSPAARETVRPVDTVYADKGKGLLDDHHAKHRSSRRQVTLIQFEHLSLIAKDLGLAEVRPEWLRRNLVISGIDLASVKNQTFKVGGVILRGTGTCPPCSRMDETLGAGGRRAMKGRGGITAIVMAPGTLRVGDDVSVIEDTPLFPADNRVGA